MLSDTLTSIENQFFDGLKAVQDPTVDVARKAAELVSRVPFLEQATALTSQLPSAESIVAHNFGFAQRLLEVQRDFALQLAGIGLETPAAPAKAAKKSAA
jgi:hypothetical protein